jgi:hypothetical protein
MHVVRAQYTDWHAAIYYESLLTSPPPSLYRLFYRLPRLHRSQEGAGLLVMCSYKPIFKYAEKHTVQYVSAHDFGTTDFAH